MTPFELIEVDLDRKRRLLLNHAALFKAEIEINKLRGAKPEDYAAIDTLMVDGFNRVVSRTGLLPMDLLVCMLWAGLLHEEPKLTLDQVSVMLDLAPEGRGEISARVWEAYFKAAGKNIIWMKVGESEAEKKTTTPGTGSNNGALRESS